MTDYCSYVNVFQGCEEIDLPKPEGIAATWHFIKAITGNTHPGAQLPFGRISAGCYSSGYPTGYTNHLVNCSPELHRFGDEALCYGFSHMHMSGTGTMGIYYNYAVTMPFYGNISDSLVGQKITREVATPGYYSLVTGKDNTKCELTAAEYCVIHRYTFDKANGRISIDLSNDSFRMHSGEGGHHGEEAEITCNRNTFAAKVKLRGIDTYFYGVCENAEDSRVWFDGKEEGDSLSTGKTDKLFGVCFDVCSPCATELKLGISFKSAENAKKYVSEEKRKFDEVAADARKAWNNRLSKIEIDAPSERDREIFYSNFYHSLVKPADLSGESVFYNEEDFMCDIATMWDIYKTQLPLIFTLYSDVSEKILNTFASFCRVKGTMPHSLTMELDGCDHNSQAMMLCEHSVYDAFLRGIDTDYKKLLKVSVTDLYSKTLENVRNNTCYRLTHVVDASEACSCLTELCDKIGFDSTDFKRYKDIWPTAFDEKTGLLKADSDYYEGSEWNFSFRPMRDMDKRIELAGGREKFVELLDKFFGYSDPQDVSCRYEGYNNESDMEAPLSYYYAGRHDKLCEVSNAGLRYMFSDGRGGIPGNNDSGGLSSLCMWHAAGIHPVTGQNLMIIGSPLMNSVTFHLHNGKDFSVEKQGNGIYVSKALLNGKLLDKRSITVEDMMDGGKLTVIMIENSQEDMI